MDLIATAAAALDAPTPVWVATGIGGLLLLGFAAARWMGGDEANAGASLDVSESPGATTAQHVGTGHIIQNSTVTVTTVSASGGAEAKRKVLDVTTEYLTGLYTGHTDIQGARLVQPYLGKWLKVTGEVANVSPWRRGYASVDLEGRLDLGLYFTDKDYVDDRLAVLRIGEPVSIVGEIEKITRTSVWLDNCELVESD